MPGTISFPFLEAVQSLAGKKLLPTNLGSAELRQLDAALKRQSLFSARTTVESYLQDIKKAVESVVNPRQEQREDRVTEDNPEGNVTIGLNPATAREQLRQKLRGLRYEPGEGEAGTIKDLSSDARINLVVKTNTEMAQGAGRFIQANDPAVLDGFPAMELVRYEDRDQPRDWEQRWRIAASVANDPAAAAALELHGRMAALKDSGIWQELGDGAGGYADTLGNPYPPFAFNSGMWIESVAREDAIEIGLLTEGETVSPRPVNLASIFGLEAAA